MNVKQIPIVNFLRKEDPLTLRFVVAMSSISGLAGGSILAIINTAASVETPHGQLGEGQHRLLLLFVVTLSILIVSKWLAYVRSEEGVENLLNKLRLRISRKIRNSELETVESLDESEVFTTMARDTGVVSQAVTNFATVCQQSLLLVAGLVYLAWLSKVAFVLFAIAGTASAYFYWSHLDELQRAYKKDHEKQSEFFAYLTHLLRGFKELSLSHRKGQEIFADMSVVANEAKANAVKTGRIYAQTSMFSDLTLYVLLGVIVFILPQLSPTYSDTLVKTTIAVMFVFAPMGAVIGTLPQISNADSSLKALYVLERRLDEKLTDRPRTDPQTGLYDDFEQIVCEELVFNYVDPDDDSVLFSAGPFDLTLHRGELLFIVGGNGSGKTTLLKLLTGLYHAKTGVLKVDGRPINGSNRREYRELFAGVLSDFHLFDRLYGVGQIDEKLAAELLEMMEIAHKVDIVDGRFSTLDLSTGQRKRLALIASLLEDRKIYFFDEWSADQDPQFRAHFYRSILPRLREKGKTIIAITHDERYWDVADRMLKLNFGKIEPNEFPEKSIS